MLTRFTQFLASLQEADEHTQQRWVMGASIVSMVFIVLLWLVYLTYTIPPLEEPVVAGEGNTTSTAIVVDTTAAPVAPSFFGTFSRGFSILIQRAETGIASFAGTMADTLGAAVRTVNQKNVTEIQTIEPLPSVIAPPPDEYASSTATSTPATSTTSSVTQ